MLSGDLVAARALAAELMAQLQALSGRREAVLILTAVFAHLCGGVGPDPTVCDVVAYLERLAAGPGPAWLALGSSRLQFARYVATDFDHGADPDANIALSLAIQSLRRWSEL